MSESRMIKALIKKWWLILIVTLVSTGGSAFYNGHNSNPIFKATTTLYIMPTSDNNNSIITSDSIIVSQQLAKDYIELIKSDKITSAVAEGLGLKGVTADTLSSNVIVDMVKGSNLLEIAAYDVNQEKAKSIANAFADISIEKITGITNQTNFNVVDEAKLPLKPIATNKYMIVILSFILSTFAICGVIITLDYIQNTVHTVDQIEKELGYSVIGIIPEMDIR